MLYSNYEKKIEKIQKVFKKIYKFRVLIIIIIGLILAASVFLMSIKGKFSSNLTISNSNIYYGQDYTCNANAYLSSIEYEFYDSNFDSWETEKPYKVGEYKVRAKSKKAFGAAGYSNEVSFNILPVETNVAIKEETLVYGQQPTPYVTLIGNDKINDYSYELNGIEVGENEAKIERVSIVNDKGEDVTSCYNFNFIVKNVLITQKELKITFMGAEKVYDGMPLFCEEYLTEGIEYEDKIEILECPQLTDAGEIVNDVKFKLVNKQGLIVNDNYKITIDAKKLCVKKRQISIKPKDEYKIYDAKPLVPKEYELISGEILSTHYFSGVVFFGEGINCGKQTSSIQGIDILDDNKNIVTSNYDITLIDGCLEILPCKVEIKANATKTYDATNVLERSCVELDITRYDGAKGLFDGHEIEYELIENPEAINVGIYTLKFRGQPIIKFDGSDITFNYEITCFDGILEIEKRPLSIVIDSKSKEYDRTPLTCNTYKIVSGSLVNTHTLSLLGQSPSITLVGEIINDFEIDIVDKNGESVYSNYDLTKTPGKLIITKRQMKINLYDVKKIYNGNTADIDKRYWCEVNKLLEGDSISDIYNYSVFNSSGEEIEENNIISAGEYIVKAECSIDYAESYANYYEIEVSGHITVEKAEIKITSDSATKVYNDNKLIANGYEITLGKLASTDEIEVKITGEQKSVGESLNTIESISINEKVILVDGDGVYESDNYIIIVKQGTLKITKN